MISVEQFAVNIERIFGPKGKQMKVAAIIQARSASTRLPNKVRRKLGHLPAIDHLQKRLNRCDNLDAVIMAIPLEDESLKGYCNVKKWQVFGGHPENVRARVLDCTRWYDIDIIVDITADCPLVDPGHVDDLVSMVKNYGYDYASNINPRSFPDGFDVQVYKTKLLQEVHDMIPLNAPHVGWQIITRMINPTITWTSNIVSESPAVSSFNLEAPPQFTFPEMRLTLDTKEDAEVLDQLFIAGAANWSAIEIIAYMVRNPKLQEINKHVRTKAPEEG